MSAPRKLYGGGNAEATRLKALWPTLADEARECWRSLFLSDTAQSEIRRQLHEKLNINLRHDQQLKRFRNWLDEQDARDEEAERMLEDEQRLTEQFGDTLSSDEVRNRVLKASYARTLARGDFKLGLATALVDLKGKEASLEREKFEELKRKAAKAEEAMGALGNAELTDEERKLRMRELFGVT
jgi:hypothetical protein